MKQYTLNINEAAKFLNCSIHKIASYAHNKKLIEYEKRDNRIYFNEEDLTNLENWCKDFRLRKRKDSLYNYEFSIIDNEIKAYFLGLLYSDGNISEYKKKNTIEYCIRISLHIDEKYILEKLKEGFPYFRLQEFDYSKYNSNQSKQFSLQYNGKHIYNDLLKHGLIRRKSYENKNLLTIPKTIPENLIQHFVRGYFDGDGSISIPSNRPNLRRIEICSVSETMLDSLAEWFKSKNCTIEYKRVKFNEKIQKQNLFIIEWITMDSVLKLRNLFYSEATIYFTRKKEKFDSFKIIDKTDRGIVCPSCGHNKIISNGKRQMQSQLMCRYECKNCKKQFSLPVPYKKSEELLETPKDDGTIF